MLTDGLVVGWIAWLGSWLTGMLVDRLVGDEEDIECLGLGRLVGVGWSVGLLEDCCVISAWVGV